MAGVSLRCAYQFALAPLTEQEEKQLAAAFSAARKTANLWKAPQVQQTTLTLLQLQQRAASPPAASCATDAPASPPAPAAAAAAAADARKRLQCLKPLVRRGIPIELRPTQWHVMSGAAAKQAAAGPGAYARLAATAAAPASAGGLPRDTQLTLSEDLSPACFNFATHPVFRTTGGRDALRRVMGAYLLHNPGGYFRGLAHVAGFVLIVMSPMREEAAFWVLAALMEDKLFPACDGQAAYGFKVEGLVLERLVARKLPKVAAHLAKLGTDAAALLAPWLACLFTTVLPSEVTARLFDALLLEGNKVLLRAALALLKTYEATITASSHPGQLRKVLDARATRLYDADALLGLAFRGLGPLPGASIAPLRAAAAATVDESIAQQRAALEAVVCRTH